jgi:adenylylsulfate kinase
MQKHIHPIFATALQKEEKETALNQRGLVIWMVGLSGSGKSTLAKALENKLHSKGHLTQLLDGDNLRTGINNNLGFTPADRKENIRRTAEVAKLFANCGIVTICSFICPTNELQNLAASIIGEDMYSVFVSCPVEVCEQRDVKGLYAKARKGEIPNFTGISAPFESPQSPDITVETNKQSLEESLELLYASVQPKIRL